MNRLRTLFVALGLASVSMAGCGSGEKSSAPEMARNSPARPATAPLNRDHSANDDRSAPWDTPDQATADVVPFPDSATANPELPHIVDDRPMSAGVNNNDFPVTEELTPSTQPTIRQPTVYPHTAAKPFKKLSPRPMIAPPVQEIPNASAALESTAAPRSIKASPQFDASTSPVPNHLDRLPAGSSRAEQDGFATVQVFYATDRERISRSELNQNIALAALAVVMLPITLGLFWVRKRKLAICVGTAACGLMFVAQLQHVQRSDTTANIAYNGQRGQLVRGVCTVTVPDTHQRGMVERPSLLRFEIKEDQEKHVVLTSATELDENRYYDQLRETLGHSPDNDLLVFIHGFNVDFDSAIRRTAQIAVDLPFRGVPVCYSWPSQGSLLSYTADENNAAWTVFNLKQFLLELCKKSDARSINVIAHSMGNRAMTAALSQISGEVDPQQLPLFDRLVLAAPDVDADLFKRELAPRLAAVSRNVTLYASSDDQALVVSKKLHGGYPRAGESGADLVVIPQVETVDVSGIDLSLLGHSYYRESESILRDLFGVVRDRMKANQRQTLTAQQKANLPYWILRQPQMSANNTSDIR